MKGKFWFWGAAAVAAAVLLRRKGQRTSLKGKVVLLTGGSRGLGLELARRCLAKGAKVALLARDAEKVDRAVLQLDAPDQVIGIGCDVGSVDEVRSAVANVEARLGPIDVLMHAAGTITVGPMETMVESDYRRAMDTHFYGALHAVEAVLPGMRQRHDGSIVLVSSIAGKVATPHLLPYTVSKFALTGFGEGLHAELARDGIRVTSVTPGLMRTGSPRNVDVKGDAEREYAWFVLADSLPLVSMNAERAASRIVDACERGQAELLMVPFGKMLLAIHALAPGLFATVLAGINRLLPDEASTTDSRKGHGSESPLTRSPLTALTRDAELRNNELP